MVSISARSFRGARIAHQVDARKVVEVSSYSEDNGVRVYDLVLVNGFIVYGQKTWVDPLTDKSTGSITVPRKMAAAIYQAIRREGYA